MKRKIRTPEAWVGKRVDHLDWEHSVSPEDGRMVWWNYDICDDCQRFFKTDDLHALLYPQSEADWVLQKKLHVEEAQSFCPDCLSWIEDEADAIDPDWRKRHGYA